MSYANQVKISSFLQRETRSFCTIYIILYYVFFNFHFLKLVLVFPLKYFCAHFSDTSQRISNVCQSNPFSWNCQLP